VACGSHCCWIYAVCDVTKWRHIHVCTTTFWRSLLTQDAYYPTRTLLNYCSIMFHRNEHTSALQIRRLEKNTALSAKTEQFITAKISDNALKQRIRKYSLAWASAEIFAGRGKGKKLRILFRLLTMLCKWTITKLFSLSTPQGKCPCYTAAQLDWGRKSHAPPKQTC